LLTAVKDTILEEQQQLKTLIGFRGVTGAGGSTLINAILRMRDLLPIHSTSACTAVPVEVAYNFNDDEDQLFRAEVEFATREEWEQELDLLFRDVKAHLSHGWGSNVVEDHDRIERIMDALDKVKYVYPELKSIADLRGTSVSQLLDEKHVKGILGSTTFIRSRKQSQFSRAIIRYIATEESYRKDFAHWPLVKCVKIFVKSKILETGIVLVDLPGSMDSNAARGAVAGNYQKHLAMTCIVFDGRRGVSDANVSQRLCSVLFFFLVLTLHR